MQFSRRLRNRGNGMEQASSDVGTHERIRLHFFSLAKREKKSMNSPVCALVHAQAPGLCGHDSNPFSHFQKGAATPAG